MQKVQECREGFGSEEGHGAGRLHVALSTEHVAATPLNPATIKKCLLQIIAVWNTAASVHINNHTPP
eukprot:scaffold127255_cov17-Tisochrysis_lutea.AAC.1